MNQRSSTPTPKIENAIETRKLISALPQRRLNISRALLPDRDEVLCVR